MLAYSSRPGCRRWAGGSALGQSHSIGSDLGEILSAAGNGRPDGIPHREGTQFELGPIRAAAVEFGKLERNGHVEYQLMPLQS